MDKAYSIQGLPIDALDKICAVLECQPADLIEYVEDETVHEKVD